MKKWTDFYDIKEKLEKKWKNGEILRNIVEDKGLFPEQIKINGPNSNEMSLKFEQVINWINLLKEKEKKRIGYGYYLIEKEINFRIVGKNSIPVYAIIETTEDALRFLNKKVEAKIFQRIIQEFSIHWKEHPNFSSLREWFLKYPFKVIKEIGEKSSKIISVIDWFIKNPFHYLYIRQLDIEGVDTKFIEKNQTILGELLKILLPSKDFDLSQKNFEDRFRLRKKPFTIRFRILDTQYVTIPFKDITVPLEEFESWENTIEKIFLVENEINFLSFPNVKNSIVIFGSGYNVHLICNVQWLKNKKIYYWGDIDTHGFNILSIVRGFLPNTISFLMNEKILLEHKELWVEEEKLFTSEIKNLTLEEKGLVLKLQNNYFGNNVRLEQERIRFKYLVEWIIKLRID